VRAGGLTFGSRRRPTRPPVHDGEGGTSSAATSHAFRVAVPPHPARRGPGTTDRAGDSLIFPVFPPSGPRGPRRLVLAWLSGPRSPEFGLSSQPGSPMLMQRASPPQRTAEGLSCHLQCQLVSCRVDFISKAILLVLCCAPVRCNHVSSCPYA